MSRTTVLVQFEGTTRSRGSKVVGAGSLLSAIVAGLLVAGCPHTIEAPSDAIEDPVVLLAHVQARLNDVSAARFRTVAEYYGGDLRGANFRNVVLVEQPDKLTVDVLSPFDTTLRRLASNGETMALYDIEEQVYYYGQPTPQNIARILPFYMSAADIVRVMLGAPPLDQFHPDPDTYELTWDGEQTDGGAYRLEVPLRSGGGHLVMWIRHGDWTLAWGERYDADGNRLFELRMGDFTEVDGVWVPFRLRFLLEGDNPVDMSMEVESVDINPVFPRQVFELAAPPGVPQVSLD